MRDNLHIHLHCARCGARLSMATEREAAAKPKSDLAESPPPASGAFCYHVPPIMVEPCRHCIEALTGPAQRLKSAIADLTKD